MSRGLVLKSKYTRRMQPPLEVKKDECITMSESTKRQFSVFTPFCIVLVLVVIVYSLLIQLVYLQPLEQNIEEGIWEKYKQYIKSLTYVDKITIMLSYQRVVTPIQMVSQFIKTLISDSVNLADIVSWSPDNGVLTNRYMDQTQPNFRNLNDYTAGDICPFQTFYNNNGGKTDVKEYKKRQYFGWANWQQNYWDQLELEQREYLLKVDIAMSISKVIYYNQAFDGIQKYSFYSAREKDDTWYGFHPTERLMTAGRFWNKKEFGGPFSCTKQADGKYLEYNLPNPNYYVKKDQSLNDCPKNSLGKCQCSYYESQRKFPIVWRCRPWYKASIENAYVTFADAYADVNTGSLITTCSFKIVNQQTQTIDDENSLDAYTVQSIDLNIGNLQKMYGKGNLSEEYSYLVAPYTFNYDTNQGYYNYTAFYHPLMNGTKQTILNLEFANSTNKEEEIKEYQEKTKFMLDKNIREDGCSLFSTSNDDSEGTTNTSTSDSNDSKEVYIMKNGTNFYTIFSTIKVCYGNLQQQKSLKVGYLARAISEERKYSLTTTLRNNLKEMQLVIILSLVGTFVLIFGILYCVLKQFLKYNFEEPISILSHVIMEAGPQEIHQLHNSIQKGEIRTQLELKNLLSAINSVVIGVQTKVQQDLDKNTKNEEEQQIKIFKSALKTFKTVEHKIGMGMCLNNIGNIFMRREDFQTALALYKSAFLLSQEQYCEEIKSKKEGDQNNHEYLITDFTKRNFMRIYASRKYQIGCTLLKAVLHSIQLQEANLEQQLYQVITLEQNKDKEQNGTERILSDDETKTEFNNLLKNTNPDQIALTPEVQITPKSGKFLLKPSSTQYLDGFDKDKDKELPKIKRRMKDRIMKSKTETNLDDEGVLDNMETKRDKEKKQPISTKSKDNKRKSVPQNLINGITRNKKKSEEATKEVQNVLVKQLSNSEMKESGYSNEHIFSERYYKKMANKVNNTENQNTKENIAYSFSDKNSYLMQAYDLFFDVKSIFDKLGDYCSQSQYSEAYEYYSLSILNLLKLAQCQLLLGSRNFIVKELLNQSKEQIKLKIRRFNQYDSHSLHQDILIEKYYLLKAKLRVTEENYPKAVKNILQCLNYNLNASLSSNENDRSLFRYSDSRLHFFDPLDSIECIDLIRHIFQKEKITLSAYQKQYLERDYNYLKLISQDLSEPYFFEVFFKENNQQQQTFQQIEITQQ